MRVDAADDVDRGDGGHRRHRDRRRDSARSAHVRDVSGDAEAGRGNGRTRLLLELESFALQQFHEGAGDWQRANDIIGGLLEKSEPELRAEIQQLDTLVDAVAQKVEAGERQSAFDDLVTQLRTVVAREDAYIERAASAAASWNRLANVTGNAAVILLLGGVAAVLIWIWRVAFEPLVAVTAAIERLAKGDADARAVADGPTEIRQIAVDFNEMAGALAHQREQQLAFIGGVAHDLRNPLEALHVAVSLLDRKPADASRVLDRVRRQVARMDQMIGDLLDRTRIEAGRLELRLDTCDLRDIVARVVETQRDSAPARSLRLAMTEDALVVRCDPLRVEQVINNLLSNAMKYSPDSSDIDVALERDGTTAVVSVADQGIGLTPEDARNIFEPFRRGGNVGSIGGAGLGLSVTRKIVEAHGGRIDVRSRPGLGSVFAVRLPLPSSIV
jgi:signal transduction histidine kinase